MGIRTPEPPRLWRVTQPGPAASAASSLSLPAASPPAPPRCRSEEDAPRVRAAAPAAASLQHRLTAASAPAPAPRARIGPGGANGRAAQPMERRRGRQAGGSTGPRPSRAEDPGIPAPGIRAPTCRPRSSPLEPVPSNRQTLNPSQSLFWKPKCPPLSPVGLGPRVPHSRPAGLRGSAQRRDEPKRSLWAPTRGTKRAEPVWDPGRGALYWPCPGAAVLGRSLGKGGPACGSGGLFQPLAWPPPPTAQGPGLPWL